MFVHILLIIIITISHLGTALRDQFKNGRVIAVHAKYVDKKSVGVSLEALHILTFVFDYVFYNN